LSRNAVFETVLTFYAIALIIMAIAYLYPVGLIEGWPPASVMDPVTYIPVLLSLFLLVPIYAWQRSYQQRTQLSSEINTRSKSKVLFRILALYALAMSIRIPSVLLFNEPYEKTPLIVLLAMTMLLIEGTRLSAVGFKAQKLGKSLLYGLAFFAILAGVNQLVYGLLVHLFTGQTVFQSYDLIPALLTMPFMTLCVGISEEGLFRGYMQTHLQRISSLKKAMLVQAILFGVWHLVWNLSPFNPTAMAEYVVTTFLAGLLFGYFYSKTENLVPLIFAHGLWNSAQMGLTISGSATNAIQAAPPLIQILTWILPYVTSLALTALFIKYYVKRT
jgi:membrane protease YdiL (CAAX protease family)